MTEITQLDHKIEINDERDELVRKVRSEKKTGMDYKEGRIKTWHEIEDSKFGNVKKTLSPRFNVPFPFMSGFLDAYKSKIDDPFTLKFSDNRESGYRSALKVQAFYEQESKDEDADWESIDLFTKDSALTYGRGINKSYPEVNGSGFKFCVEHVDPYDFYDNPLFGSILEHHTFCGQDNIFRDKYDLLEGGKSGYYDLKQVYKLLTATPDRQLQLNQQSYQAKQNRLISHGLDNKTFSYAGESLYKLVESGTMWRGKRYLVTWNEETGIWLRIVPLREVLESGLWPWSSWSPKPEANNSWAKGPSDDFLPVATAMNVFLNQELDNRNKKNWNMRAYDPDMFQNPGELEWAPDGLVAIKAGATRTRRIESGIYTFQTPDLNGTINMVEYLDNLTGTKLGITNQAQGQSNDSKVGIFFGNQQNINDRIEATSKQYRKNHIAIGRRFVWGVYQYLPEPKAIQLVGEKGLEWDKLRKNEVNPTLKIAIEGGSVQAQQDELKAKKRAEVLDKIANNPRLVNAVNPKWLTESLLRAGEYNQEDITQAMDIQNYGNKELMAEAAEAIEQLIKGQYPKLNHGANTAFIWKIVNHAYDNEVKDNIFERLIAYSEAHIPIAAENAARQAKLDAALAGQQYELPPTPEEQATMEAMMPTSPQSNSQQQSAGNTPNMPTIPQ